MRTHAGPSAEEKSHTSFHASCQERKVRFALLDNEKKREAERKRS